MARTYRPRNELIIIRKMKRGLVKGLVMPQASAEGVDFIVEAIGPDVIDLAVGDMVMIKGGVGETYYPIPGDTDLLIIEQKNVAYVITELED